MYNLQELLKSVSGNITCQDKLTSFLYELMRDHITPGQVQEIVERSIITPVTYTNGYLAEYANFLSHILTDEN